MRTAHHNKLRKGCTKSLSATHTTERGNEIVAMTNGAGACLKPPEADLLEKLNFHSSLYLESGGRISQRTRARLLDRIMAAIIEQRTGGCRDYLALRYLGEAGWRAMIASAAANP